MQFPEWEFLQEHGSPSSSLDVSNHEALVREIVDEIISLPPAIAAGTGDAIFEKVFGKEYDHNTSEMQEEIPSMVVEEPFLIDDDDDHHHHHHNSLKDEKKEEVEGDHQADCRRKGWLISRWQCTAFGGLCSFGMAIATLLIITRGKGQKLITPALRGGGKRTNQVEPEACIVTESSGTVMDRLEANWIGYCCERIVISMQKFGTRNNSK